MQSGMSTMVVHNGEGWQFSASLQFGIPYTYVMAAATKKLKDPETRLRGAVK